MQKCWRDDPDKLTFIIHEVKENESAGKVPTFTVRNVNFVNRRGRM